ncbi:TPA: hypothetical protein N0F65_000795 [Lagenidium giganteum]|uniref:Uncharacterized protein n=1 Tax=Lagenidium giganteum TaxID=4803 RepID=A0AAV2ZER0_9STRA|nr:TPA: hypothetical protein N0F65_000795 [Lagenidium giganteum]
MFKANADLAGVPLDVCGLGEHAPLRHHCTVSSERREVCRIERHMRYPARLSIGPTAVCPGFRAVLPEPSRSPTVPRNPTE